MKKKIASVAILGGNHEDDTMTNAAANLGTAIADNNFRLIYEFPTSSLVSAAVSAALTKNGAVVAVGSTAIISRKQLPKKLAAFYSGKDEWEAKMGMSYLAQSAIILPTSTFEDFIKILKWCQESVMAPTVLFNIKNHFEKQLQKLNQQLTQLHIDMATSKLLMVEKVPATIIGTLRSR